MEENTININSAVQAFKEQCVANKSFLITKPEHVDEKAFCDEILARLKREGLHGFCVEILRKGMMFKVEFAVALNDDEKLTPDCANAPLPLAE